MGRLLLADDSLDVAHLVSEMLKREGYDVDVVHDGKALVERIDAGEKYDAIITDLLMPNLDGFGVLRHLKKIGDETPVLVLSGGGVTLNSDDALRAVEGMATAVLKKPIKCAELMDKIAQAIASP